MWKKMQIETMSNKEITQQSYQATADEFASNVADLAPIGSIEKFIKLLPPKAKIIDIGCGSGRDAKIFSNMGVDVLGIDFCSNLIDIAEKNAPLAVFQLMDFETMSFPDGSFDGAWSACSLGHSSKEDLPDVLKKIHLLLKENGYFYLALKKGSGETLSEDLRYEGNFKKFWSFFEEQELTNMLQAAQFKILDFDTVEKKFTYQSHPAFRIFCQKI
ncbi:TPA: methyltransferase domain-containing protein [Legionella pneumophila]|nr:methyltransferase domain-containing protein [Legionella pneumophila]